MRIFMLDNYSDGYYNAGVASTCSSASLFVGTFIVVPDCVLVNQNNRKGVLFVNNSKFTDFGLCVKTNLLQNGKDQKWLENAISEKTGMYVDNGYMYKILTGQRNAPKIVDAIKEILELK